MLIKKDACPIQTDLYEYDFSACYYTILKNINYDISSINYDDKKMRNIQIGLLQKNNPVLANFLYEKTVNLIDSYLYQNEIFEDNIIWRQKDGIIIDKKLNENNISMELTFKKNILKLISSMDKNKVIFLYKNNIYNELCVDIKGVEKIPLDTGFYKLFFNLNFYNKNELINGIHQLRYNIFNSKKVKWFIRKSEDGSLYIPIKNTLYKINKSMIYSIDPDDINKSFLWDAYIWPFVQSLIIWCNTVK